MKKNFFLPHFEIFFRDKPGGFRIIVTRKIPRAVDRNRIKRVVREFFRLKRTLLPGESVVLKILPSAAKVKNAQLFQELNKIL